MRLSEGTLRVGADAFASLTYSGWARYLFTLSNPDEVGSVEGRMAENF
jgi:hypothetical protein